MDSDRRLKQKYELGAGSCHWTAREYPIDGASGVKEGLGGGGSKSLLGEKTLEVFASEF